MVGEFHDGGYWVVVPVVVDEIGSRSVGEIPDVGWCAWYGSDYDVYPDLAAVRTPNPVDVPQALPGFTAGELLGELGMTSVPFARIGGQ